MATATTLPVRQPLSVRQKLLEVPAMFLALCTFLALVLLGYHPAAEDGGIYASAVALRLQPTLFPTERAFAVAHTAHSLFVPLVALSVRALHLPLSVVLLLTHTVAVWLTLTVLFALSKEMFPHGAQQRFSLLLCSVSLGLPVAGTSLYLADPYLTARSLSTPLLLFCLLCLVRGRVALFAACLAASVALHPMMSGWALLLFLAFMVCRRKQAVRNAWLLAFATWLGMAAVHWLGPQDGAAAQQAALSRDYWFPTRWAWFEVVGLFAPPVILLLLASRKGASRLNSTARQVAQATALATLIVAAGAYCFIHTSNSSLLLARMQPLRLLHFAYLLFLLVLGGWVASAQRIRQVRWMICIVAALSLLSMQRTIYAHSGHVELPGTPPKNGYQQAFLWARQNTPVDALFALDAHYTAAPGEDAQLFRAVARRSSLPDAAKDGGISSVLPALAERWLAAARAQTGLATMPDTERLLQVTPFGATWMVLPASSKTQFRCPYRNAAAQVCRLP